MSPVGPHGDAQADDAGPTKRACGEAGIGPRVIHPFS